MAGSPGSSGDRGRGARRPRDRRGRGPGGGGALLADRGVTRRAAELRQARSRRQASRCSRPRSRSGSSRKDSSRLRYGDTLVKIRPRGLSSRRARWSSRSFFPATTRRRDARRRRPAARQLWSIKPAERAFVSRRTTAGSRRRRTRGGRVEVVGVLDLRQGQPPNIEARGRRSHVEAVAINGRVTQCDLLVMSGSPQPNYKLLAQAGARVVYDEAAASSSRPISPRTSRRSAPQPATSASPRSDPCSATRATSASSASARTRRRRT